MGTIAKGKTVNRVSVEARAQILHALCEGVSMRACERVFDRSFKTIRKIVEDVGDWAMAFHQQAAPVTCTRIQADEIWSFVGENDRKTAKRADKTRGVCWTYLAVDRPTKLVISHHIGTRQAVDAAAFMRKLDARLAKDDHGDFLIRPTLAVDGLKAYVDAIELAFGDRIDAGQFSKQYSKLDRNGEPLPGSRYIGAVKLVLKGKPDDADITTWLVERENGFLRQANRRFTRKTNAFSKVMGFHERQVAIWMHYRNYCWIPYPSRPTDGSRQWQKRATAAIACELADRVWTPEDMILASDDFVAMREVREVSVVHVPKADEVTPKPFWVLHSPYHRAARVHLAECSSCNRGLGKNRGPAKGSIWTGFHQFEEAVAFAAGKEPDGNSICRLCLGSYNMLTSFGPRR